MNTNHNIRDAEIERLMRAQTPEDDAGFAEIAQFLGDLDRLVPEQSTAALEVAHLAAIMAESQTLREVADDTPSPVTPARSATSVFATLMAPRWAKVASISLAALLAFGGTAYAGVLPAPLQNAVSAMFRPIGIGLLTADQARAARATTAAKRRANAPGEALGIGGAHLGAAGSDTSNTLAPTAKHVPEASDATTSAPTRPHAAKRANRKRAHVTSAGGAKSTATKTKKTTTTKNSSGGRSKPESSVKSGTRTSNARRNRSDR